jgi:hypothetical protein
LSESGFEKATQVVKAIERFVNIAGITLGLLQYLALTRAAEICRLVTVRYQATQKMGIWGVAGYRCSVKQFLKSIVREPARYVL